MLESAIKLFGDKGYAATALEDIAIDCGLTVRPIYHYYDNKKRLFLAVTEHMESRIVERLNQRAEQAGNGDYLAHWRDFLSLCEDSAFRQIVLIDSPNILGKERWQHSAVTHAVKQQLGIKTAAKTIGGQFREQLLNRLIMACFAESALSLAEAGNTREARKETEQLMEVLLSALPGQDNSEQLSLFQ